MVATDVVTPLINHIFRTWALGSGHAMKALNNYVAGAALTAAAEALIIESHYGLSPDVMADVLDGSTGRSFITETSIAGSARGSYETRFASGLLDKDVRTAARLPCASAPGQRSAVRRRLDVATEALCFGADSARAYRHWKAEDEI